MITQEYLKYLLVYDMNTGVFTWRVTKSFQSGAIAGRKAGSMASKYLSIKIDQQNYYLHKLAWLYVYGVMPEMLDHIDRDKLNNRINNLRLATRSQNLGNSKLAKNNSSGFKGVYLDRGKWKARIQVNHKRIKLGTFNSPEEAFEAYKKAAVEGFGEFASPAKAG